MIGALEVSMADMIIRTYKGEALSIHFRSPSYDPPPGADSEGFGAVLVAGVPELVSVADVLDIFKDMDHSAPRFVWTWDDFLRRVPPGRALSTEEAGEIAGLSAFMIRRYATKRRLPAHMAPRKGFKGGNIRYLFNEYDVRWFAANVKAAVGRPKKGGPGEDEEGD